MSMAESGGLVAKIGVRDDNSAKEDEVASTSKNPERLSTKGPIMSTSKVAVPTNS